MLELTDSDREEISNQIAEYKQSSNTGLIKPPLTPDGQEANEALEEALKSQATPDKKESRRIRHRIQGIWRKWRTTALDAKALEVEKIACQIEIEKAETRQKLASIRRAEEIANARHWLILNKGNLEEIDANTTSKPNMFWYGLRRGFHHITKLTTSVPRILKNLFWIILLVVALIVLKHFNVL